MPFDVRIHIAMRTRIALVGLLVVCIGAAAAVPVVQAQTVPPQNVRVSRDRGNASVVISWDVGTTGISDTNDRWVIQRQELAFVDGTAVYGNVVSRAFTNRTTAAEESCTTGVMSEGRMARGVGTVW